MPTPSPPSRGHAHAGETAITELLAEVLAAHGGLERWQRLEYVTGTVRFGGLAFALRGQLPGRRVFRFHVSTRTPRTILDDYPRRGDAGTFEPDRVWLDSGATRNLPADALRSWRRRLWWDRLDLLYFAGYALWNYLTLPFLLATPGIETSPGPPVRSGDATLRSLVARFPGNVPTHCPEQRFFADDTGRIVRHDYDPLLYASWAQASLQASDFATVGDFQFARRRIVKPRSDSGAVRDSPTLVWIRFDDLAVG